MKILKGSSLVGSGNTQNRVEYDYYATPPYATLQFLNQLEEDGLKLNGSILEPACGGGHISEVLYTKYSNITSTDIIDRGYDRLDFTADFLKHNFCSYDNVITNPPFKLIQEFISKAIAISNQKVIMFAKIQLLEGKKRYSFFKKYPPSYIYVHSSRVAPYRNGEEFDDKGKPWNSTMCFAWFVWDKSYFGEPIIRWLE